MEVIKSSCFAFVSDSAFWGINMTEQGMERLWLHHFKTLEAFHLQF